MTAAVVGALTVIVWAPGSISQRRQGPGPPKRRQASTSEAVERKRGSAVTPRNNIGDDRLDPLSGGLRYKADFRSSYTSRRSPSRRDLGKDADWRSAADDAGTRINRAPLLPSCVCRRRQSLCSSDIRPANKSQLAARCPARCPKQSDLSVARLALSEDVGRAAARLAGWSGARLGQDTIWWKAPSTKPIAHHQDSSFTDFLDPAGMVTCWVTLDDTHRDAGTLEYAPGSHLWPLTPIPDQFHGREDYRAHMRAAARAAGVEAPEPVLIEVPAGSCVFHAAEVRHGSGPNTTGDQMRGAVGIHMLF